MHVIYFQIKDAQTKLKKIIATATDHFNKREPLLILAPNAAATHYLDALLWRFPAESFLPHHAGTETSPELISITHFNFNTNHAKAIFNLCPAPLPKELRCQTLYELEDLSSEEAGNDFKLKFTTYQQEKFSITSG